MVAVADATSIRSHHTNAKTTAQVNLQAASERIVRVSRKPGNMVLDLFCRCATMLVACEHIDRHWIGHDLSPLAV